MSKLSDELRGDEALLWVIKRKLSALYGFMFPRDRDVLFVDLQISQWRDAYLARGRRHLISEGKTQVIFAPGDDPVSAIWELARALSANRWRDDRPYVPRESSDGTVVRSGAPINAALRKFRAGLERRDGDSGEERGS
jgi:hypothetical protein